LGCVFVLPARCCGTSAVEAAEAALPVPSAANRACTLAISSSFEAAPDEVEASSFFPLIRWCWLGCWLGHCGKTDHVFSQFPLQLLFEHDRLVDVCGMLMVL